MPCTLQAPWRFQQHPRKICGSLYESIQSLADNFGVCFVLICAGTSGLTEGDPWWRNLKHYVFKFPSSGSMSIQPRTDLESGP